MLWSNIDKKTPSGNKNVKRKLMQIGCKFEVIQERRQKIEESRQISDSSWWVTHIHAPQDQNSLFGGSANKVYKKFGMQIIGKLGCIYLLPWKVWSGMASNLGKGWTQYCNSNWAGDAVDRLSTSGFCGFWLWSNQASHFPQCKLSIRWHAVKQYR